MAINTSRQDPLVMRGDSYQECVENIRKVYGRDYEIIRKNERPSDGFFSFWKKKQYEITYLVLPPDMKRFMQGMPQSGAMDFNVEKNKILEANKTSVSPQLKLILDEIQSLKTATIRQDEHPTILRIEELLKKNEFTTEYIKKISDHIRKEYSLETLDDFDVIQKSVVDWIGESICVANVANTARPNIIILVGPTGVGKTTTVAKLAANYINPKTANEQGTLNVRIITTDSYRIGAKEQLEKYGEVMRIPVSLVNTADDMQKLLTMYGHGVDVILVDTTGHSPKDYESLAKMRKVLDFHGGTSQVFLTVSASTKASDLRIILQQYEIFGYTSLIITKLDETDCIGTVISILDEKQKHIAYFTDGQRVPRDFEKANPVRMLINLSGFHVDRKHIDEKFSQEEVG